MKMKVTYEAKGNRPEVVKEYKVKPRHLVQFEDEVGEFTETAKSGYMLAWMASDTPDSFKDWLNTVEDIETVTDKGDPIAAPDGEGEASEPVPTE